MFNLIICQTPLQVKIVTEIVKKNNYSKNICVYGCYKKNNKHTYYSKELEKISIEFFFVEINNYNIENIIDNLKNKSIERIIFASFDSPLVLSLTSYFINTTLISFDDGFACVDPNSFYLLKTTDWGYYYSKEDLKNKVEKHYTIFNNFSLKHHVIDNKRLDKIDLNIDVYFSGEGKIKILLGQLLGGNPNMTADLISKIMRDFSIDYYFPHPRNTIFIDDIKTIETNLVFEDYIFELSSDFKEIEVYHFYSTSAAVLRDVKGINFIGIPLIPLKEIQDVLIDVGYFKYKGGIYD